MKPQTQFLLALAITILAKTGIFAAQLIGPEASLPLPNSALWSTCLNNRPGNGETVALNPPQFVWSYTPDPLNLASDFERKAFIFEIASDSGFTSIVSNLTSWNFYNTLAPLATNTTLYWRIGYCHESNSTAYAWSSTRTFVVSNAVRWDRSMLADATYLSNKAAHPHILLNASNRVSLWSWLETAAAHRSNGTASAIEDGPGHGWSEIKSQAVQAITSVTWPTNVPSTMWVGPSGSWAGDIANVSFMWALTRAPAWSNAHPERALVQMANWYLTNANQWYMWDIISSSTSDAALRGLAVGYDWCYDLMDSTQRTKVAYALAMRCRFLLCGFDTIMWGSKTPAYAYGKGDSTGAYRDGLYTRYSSQAKLGHSHGTDNFYHGMIAALAAYGEHPWARDFFDMGVNYMLGPTYLYSSSMGVGRGYTAVHLWLEERAMPTHVNFHISFPEAGFTNNPFWFKITDWYDRALPFQFNQGHEPWGDGGYGRQDYWQSPRMGRAMTLWTGNGRYKRHWLREWDYWKNVLIHDHPSDTVFTAPFPYYFNTNIVEQDTTNLSVCYTNEGWVITSSDTPSAGSGFTNGVGLIFQARPAGSITGHGLPSDGAFQIWAYGAMITDSGSADIYGSYNEFEKVPWSHYTLLVNGLGQCQPQNRMVEPWYSRIYAYTNCDSFTYCAADLTAAYARSNFVAGGDTVPQKYAALHSGGPLAYVGKVTREILFNRKKYFVIYDTLQTVNAPTNTFSWIYHVMENTLSLNTQKMSFTYTATNSYRGSNVTVYVAHIVDPAALSVTNLTGSKVRVNPITGENYWTNSPPSNVGDIVSRAHALWFSNRIPTNDWHFMSVIYPVKPGTPAPLITRLDDYTVEVTSGAEHDVISFDSHTSYPATLIVDSQAAGPARLAPPRGLRVR